MIQVLILGSSSWIAHYLIDELLGLNYKLIGVSNRYKPTQNIKNVKVDIEDESFISKVISNDFNVLINMLHSDNYQKSLTIHKLLSDFCIENNKHYVYCSSSNALDADVSRVHEESELANGGSEYGLHKALCEQYLYEQNPSACIFRFPAVHGYAPNRVARTEQFLRKLKRGEKVKVARGIYQNRPFVGSLAKMMAQIIDDRSVGIFHLGTYDFSEEYEFLKKLAVAFGYSEDDLISGDQYDFNMTVVPKRVYDDYGEKFLFFEHDTIEALASCPHLEKYKKA